MPIVHASVLPHGALVLKPEDELSGKLKESMEQVAAEVIACKPDLVFLSTPHGLMLQQNFALYHSQKGKGTAEWQGEYQEFELEIDLQIDITKELAQHLNTELITPHAPILPIELRWGEVIPLYFIYQKISPPAVILSHPARRYEHPERMELELRQLGQKMFDFFEHRTERVAVVISGDWAHTHQEDGPYGFSETALRFDETIAEWLETLHLKNDQWIQAKTKAADLVNSALSCGYTGLMFLDGIVQTNWTGKLHEIGAPSYYGMAVASYSPLAKKNG